MNIRKAIAEMKLRIESTRPVDGVKVIFPGEEEPGSGLFIRVNVVDASAGNGNDDTQRYSQS